MPAKIFKKFFRERKLHLFLKIILGLNLASAFFLLLSYLATHVSPANFTWLAFFGLAYPFLLLINFLFFVLWLVLRNKWSLLSLSVFLIGFNHFRHFFQITLWSGPNSESSTKIKVMSYNVRLFDLYNWVDNKTTRNKIFEVLSREDADIYCFQEFFVRDGDDTFETRDSMKLFLRAKNVHEGYTHYIPVSEQQFGLATFSVYPIVGKQLLKFENDKNNCVLITDIKIKNDTIRVFNVHLSSIRFQKADYEFIGDQENSKTWTRLNDPDQKIYTRLKNAFVKRAEQVEIVELEISKSPHKVILCGDFNDTPISYAYRRLTRNLTDAFVESGNGIGNTYIGKFPSFRIDYILHSDELHSYDFNTLTEKLSDHHPITCTIELPE